MQGGSGLIPEEMMQWFCSQGWEQNGKHFSVTTNHRYNGWKHPSEACMATPFMLIVGKKQLIQVLKRLTYTSSLGDDKLSVNTSQSFPRANRLKFGNIDGLWARGGNKSLTLGRNTETKATTEQILWWGEKWGERSRDRKQTNTKPEDWNSTQWWNRISFKSLVPRGVVPPPRGSCGNVKTFEALTWEGRYLHSAGGAGTLHSTGWTPLPAENCPPSAQLPTAPPNIHVDGKPV